MPDVMLNDKLAAFPEMCSVDTQILKKYHEVKPYIDSARKCADLHKTELGFLTPSAYDEQALQDKLWVCIDKKHNLYLGHLLFGGKYPYLKIFQLVVHPDYRKEMIPFLLISELEEYGVENSYLNITARVAEDLPANKFWDFVGLKFVRQVQGGQARSRKINLRSKDLETASLLSLIEHNYKHDCRLIDYKQSPVLSSNLYVLDINILLDITKNRTNKKQASAIIRAGLNNNIKIAVTDEFVKELRRAKSDNHSDPLLEFACELPTITVDDKTVLKDIINDLRKIIFPDRCTSRKDADQDNSDLVHIAVSIFTKADGFITREKAILRAKDMLLSKYNLDIISPLDIDEPGCEQIAKISINNINGSNKELRIESINEAEVPNVLLYFSKINLKKSEVDKILSKGTTGSLRQRLVLYYNDLVIGVVSWDVASNITKEISAYFIISEDCKVAEKAIDHILETIIRSNNADARRIVLYCCQDQVITKSTAISSGFRSEKINEDTILASLTKISINGVVNSKNWHYFVNKFKINTGLILPREMPSCTKIDDKCISLSKESSDNPICISYFELETLISPGILMSPERSGVLLPIQPYYATELGLYQSNQQSLFSKKEAFLHIEKAYFRKNINTKNYQRGKIVFFYISKKSECSQSVVGCARITYSDAITSEVICKKFYRQGVLPLSKLNSLQDRNGLIHVITFDSFRIFKNTIPFSVLKDKCHVSGNNLVTGEPQNYKQTCDLLEYAYK